MAPPANPSSPLNNKETEYNAIRCISPKGDIEIGGDGRGDTSSRPSAYIDQHSLLRKVEDEEEDGADNEDEGENDIGGIEVRSLVRGTGNQAPIWSCVAVLANNMMGAGTLGLPHAVAQTGWLFGGSLLVISCLISVNGLHLLTLSAGTVKTSPTSFYAICHKSIPKWTWIIDLAIAVKCFGVAISYLIIVGDLMPLALKEWQGHEPEAPPIGLWEQRWIWISLAFLLVMPLSFAPRLTALKYTSGLSVGIVLCLALVTCLYAAGVWDPCALPGIEAADASSGDEACRGTYNEGEGDLGALKVLPIFIFAFTCHQNYPVLINEMMKPTKPRVLTAIAGASGISLATYLLIAEAGYLTYGSAINNDLLQTFPSSNLITVLRAFMSLLVTFTYPLQAHPARACILAIWRSATNHGREPAPRIQALRYVIITLVFLAASFMVSLSVKDIAVVLEVVGVQQAPPPSPTSSPISSTDPPGYLPIPVLTPQTQASFMVSLSVKDIAVVLEVVGATGSTTVSYLLPGIIYYLLHPAPHLRRQIALGQFLLGLIIIPTCLTAIFLKSHHSTTGVSASTLTSA